jgi:hypothetical protein
MCGQSEKIDNLLRQRMSVVRELFDANAEHHRLLQRASGRDFLAMQSGNEADRMGEQETTEPEIKANAAVMVALHLQLDQIDAAMNEADSKREKT